MKIYLITYCDSCQGKQNAYYLLLNGFGSYQPINYDFPKRGTRKFQSKWFNSFPWLEYSPGKNSACFTVVPFHLRKLANFICKGFRQWSKLVINLFQSMNNRYLIKNLVPQKPGVQSRQRTWAPGPW